MKKEDEVKAAVEAMINRAANLIEFPKQWKQQDDKIYPAIVSTVIEHFGTKVQITFSVGIANETEQKIELALLGDIETGQALIAEVLERFSDHKFPKEPITSKVIAADEGDKTVPVRFIIEDSGMDEFTIRKLFSNISNVVNTMPTKLLVINPVTDTEGM